MIGGQIVSSDRALLLRRKQDFVFLALGIMAMPADRRNKRPIDRAGERVSLRVSTEDDQIVLWIIRVGQIELDGRRPEPAKGGKIQHWQQQRSDCDQNGSASRHEFAQVDSTVQTRAHTDANSGRIQ